MSPNNVEQWKPVNGFDLLYEVSNHGRVRNISPRPRTSINRIRKPQINGRNGRGYYFVVLSNGREHRRQALIHHLVAEAFIGPRPAGYEINHLDGDKLNNHAENLEYCTVLENHQHASRTGLAAFGDRNGSRKHPERLPRGQDNFMTKLQDAQVSEIKQLLKLGLPQAEIGRKFNIAQSVICRINTGQIWKHIQ
ncbi:MAG TPA: NUMOD4 motif-containing HNH endonuclease [Pyrinomonadaceae bacterium]|nr:NUMOD4 motif-containing HNH endonuclease [Pyrinomonadaceae bacterium]